MQTEVKKVSCNHYYYPACHNLKNVTSITKGIITVVIYLYWVVFFSLTKSCRFHWQCHFYFNSHFQYHCHFQYFWYLIIFNVIPFTIFMIAFVFAIMLVTFSVNLIMLSLSLSLSISSSCHYPCLCQSHRCVSSDCLCLCPSHCHRQP